MTNNTQFIKLDSNASADIIESAITSIINDAVIEIEFPIGMKKRVLGASSLLFQLYITASIKSKKLFLTIPVLDVQKYLDDPSDLIDNPNILIGLLMADDLLLGKDKVPAKAKLNTHLTKRFGNNTLPLIKRQLQLFCVDHSIPEFRFPGFFYDRSCSPPTMRDRDSFLSLFYKYCSENNINKISSEAVISISRLMHELTINTDQHALSDENNQVLDRSVRGILINHHLYRRDQEIQLINYYKDLKEYISTLKEDFDKKDLPLQFLEITVFDSGPGISKRYKELSDLSSVSIYDEFRVLTEAYQKGASSKKYNDMEYGKGTYRALQAISKNKGFISLRSGRLRVKRNLLTHPYSDGPIELFDGVSNVTDSITQMGEVVGSHYVIIVPLNI